MILLSCSITHEANLIHLVVCVPVKLHDPTLRRLGARDLDYTIRLYYIGINTADESIERIKNRVRKGGHNITDEDVERRFEKRFEDLVKILPFCSEVRFYDNENGFVDVAEYKNGSLIIKGGYIPEWIIELKEYMAMGETEDEAITPVILLRY